MKNSDSETDKDFIVEDLLTRGWALTLIERFLGREDYRNPVDHFQNYAGKKMFQRRRVELTEASAEFEAAFTVSAKPRRFPSTGSVGRVGWAMSARGWVHCASRSKQ
jgi:hypothetical protein